ncbi:dTDP-4-dehydrorhamnose 3,5-epimerase family protein [Polynucleobacter sp. MG-27-Goln-C1]|uniref:dTDP-4-dehydrorhamnose 3,5-epimerase family protein n=1 Tax=Polynucleobacter sp. MG-27-Goln-C1 TaxID=1819726 RepID=UPI0021039733|nr:dTDP-4-dehydrorhamnose 3,5-epimerase family protein [Polynucleobacter sp. MG-27-Goln-C1]MBU3612853.1 dTDP-4-dehydrorhamnose 3,5-epimerase family protein [Polynucleobacter sp. MG-27-Goln-C1]
MQKINEILPKTWLVSLDRLDDSRGTFVKTLSKSMLHELNFDFLMHEEYYSVSNKDVVRGMHFQVPPHDHVKIVYCPKGAVLDVLLDLRPGPTYGKTKSMLLEASSPSLLIIPQGIAHGFKSLADGSLLVYKTSSEYAPKYDAGIIWNSFSFDWGIKNPILSSRDLSHPSFEDFQTPFPCV